MGRHLNRLNNEEAAEFDKAFEEFCEAENQENKMNTDFYLTIMSKLEHQKEFAIPRLLYFMVICPITTHNPVFTSDPHPNKADLIEVGKAYAKRLNIIYREGDVE